MFESSSVCDVEVTAGMTTLPARTEVPEWRQVDRRLRGYARHRCALDAAEAFDLVRAKTMKLYALAGCATHWEYMERELGYGAHAARERMRVATKIAALPIITAEFAQGDRKYSAVRALTRVATPETEVVWLAATKGMHGAQIEEMVRGRAPGDLPTDPKRPELRMRELTLVLPPEVFALWRQVRSKLADDLGHEVSDAEVIDALGRMVLDPSGGTQGPTHQIALKQCDDCKRVTQNGAGREIDVELHVLERAACDATNLGSLDAATPARITKSVTPRVRMQVFARDGQRCRVPGCRSARNLEVHHIIEQCRGGTSELSNLILLCSGHHAALHAGLLSITGQAPYDVQVKWIYKPLPPNLDPDTRQRLFERKVMEMLGSPLERDRKRVPAGTFDDGTSATDRVDSIGRRVT